MFATRVFQRNMARAVQRTDVVKVAATVGWSHPATVELPIAGLPRRCGSGTTVRKDMRPARPKSLTTKTIACPYSSASSIHYSRAGGICASGSEWRVQSEASGRERVERMVQFDVSGWEWGIQTP
jgi:hypothetical protein